MNKRKAKACELNQPLWAVISSSGVQAINITYAQAMKALASLPDSNSLCIVTAQAAKALERVEVSNER